MRLLLSIIFLAFTLSLSAQVNVAGYIQTIGGGTYPTHMDSLARGGFRSVADTTERNNIPTLRRKVGMFVFVNSNNLLYRLSALPNTWVVFSTDLTPYLLKTDTTAFLANYASTPGWGLLKSSKTIRIDSVLAASRAYVRTQITNLNLGTTYFPLLGGTLTGTGGAGFYGLPSQSANPSAPSSGLRIFANAASALGVKNASGRTYILSEANTADRTYTLPDATGTFALTSNLTSYILKTDTTTMLAIYPSTFGWGTIKGTKTVRVDSALVASQAYVRTSITNLNLGATYYPKTGGFIIGTGGTGFFGMISQSANPTTFPSSMALFANSSNVFSVKNGAGLTYSFPHSNTADRAYTLPDASGTIALTSNLITSLTGDVTASGTGAIATTIANSAVTKIKIASAAVDSTKAAALSPNNIAQTLANTGDVLTWTGSKYAPRPAASSGFSAVGGTLTGTGGAGFFGMLNQSAAPTTVSSGLALYANASNALSVKDASGFVYGFSESNTADRLYTLQNASGTIPLLQSTQTWSGVNNFTGFTGFNQASPTSQVHITPSYSSTGDLSGNGYVFRVATGTVTNTSGASTIASGSMSSFDGGVVNSTNATTYTSFSTVRIGSAPSAGTNTSITNSFGLEVNAAANFLSSVTVGNGLNVNAINSTSSNLNITRANSGTTIQILGGLNNNLLIDKNTASGGTNGYIFSTNTLAVNPTGVTTSYNLAQFSVTSTTKGSMPFPIQTTANIAANYSGIATITLTNGGTGYTNGSYTSIALTGGTGTGAVASITVSGGAVTVVTITTAGSGYQVGDVLSASNATIGGGSGSGLVITVATITTPAGLFVYNSTIGRLGYNNADSWKYLIGSSQTSIPNTQIAFGDANGNLQSSSTLVMSPSGGLTINSTIASSKLNISNGSNTDIIVNTSGDLQICSGNTRDVSILPGNNRRQIIFGVNKGSIISDNNTVDASVVASAVLSLNSTTRGFLPPVMTTTQRDAISSPANLLVIANSTTTRLNIRDNTFAAWREIPTMPNGGLTQGSVVVGDANGNIISGRGFSKAVQTQNANYDASSDLTLFQTVNVYADQTSGASANTTVTLPTPSATFVGQSVVIYAADAALTFKVTVSCTSGIWYSTGLASAPTTFSTYDITDATTSLAWGNVTLTCMLLPGSIYRWVVTNQQ